MLRSQNAAQAAPPSAAAGRPQAQATPATAEQRSEMARVIASSLANRAMSSQDRAYLAQIITQRTGAPQPEAEKRVDDAFKSAREAADKARRASILAGFVTAASLILSFGAAWWAAMSGGHHRDNSVPARFEFGNRLRRPNIPGA